MKERKDNHPPFYPDPGKKDADTASYTTAQKPGKDFESGNILKKAHAAFRPPAHFKKTDSGLRTKFSPIMVISLVVLVLYMISLCGLLLWAFMTSFKSFSDFRINKIGLPKKWVWNYGFVYRKYEIPIKAKEGIVYIGMKEMFVNSFTYSLGCTFFATFTPCITAYLCARFPYKFGRVIYMTVIVAMILPIVGSLPSEIMIASALGLYDKIWGLWILKANFLGLYFLVFFATFKAFPDEFTDAAKMDGAGNFTILVKILLPLIRNTFFVVMLIKFIEFWNDYQIPLIYLPSFPTVAFGMYNMAKTYDNGLATPPMRMTAAMLMLIPILVIFIIFQNKLIGNLSVGGIKG